MEYEFWTVVQTKQGSWRCHRGLSEQAEQVIEKIINRFIDNENDYYYNLNLIT